MNKYIPLLLSVLACAVPKHTEVPWPGPDHEQFLYWELPDPEALNQTWRAFEEDGENRVIARWDTLPIKVHVTDLQLIDETVEAIEVWNTWMEMELFEFEYLDSEDIDIYVFDAGLYPGVAAMASIGTLDGKQTGAVLTFNNLKVRDRTDIMVHELGHLLSLRHDKKNTRSIMHPHSSPRVPYLEPRDRKALHRYYSSVKAKAAMVPQNRPAK